jgi:hypothetical protein
VFGTGSRLAVIVVLFAGVAAAQEKRPSVADLPVPDRMRPDFYHALASGSKGVTAEWSVSAATVPLDGELTLTLTVRNAANPQELVKPPLGQMPAFADKFQVLDRADPSEGRFAWTLRPRSVGPTEVPRLKYVYHKGGQFLTTYARPIPVTVTAAAPKEAPAAPPVPLDGPEEFFVRADEYDLFQEFVPANRTVESFAWLIPVAAVPLLVVGYVFAWRWLFPGAARLARLRRNRAARLALDRLRAAAKSADPAGTAAAAVRGYLAARFAVPPSAQTPPEVAAAARAAGLAERQAADAEGFLRACDEARFSGSRDTGVSLAATGEALVTGWEERDV